MHPHSRVKKDAYLGSERSLEHNVLYFRAHLFSGGKRFWKEKLFTGKQLLQKVARKVVRRFYILHGLKEEIGSASREKRLPTKIKF